MTQFLRTSRRYDISFYSDSHVGLLSTARTGEITTQSAHSVVSAAQQAGDMETCRVLFEYNSVEEDEISLPVDEVYQEELLLKEFSSSLPTSYIMLYFVVIYVL